jgi:hypothetical protein
LKRTFPTTFPKTDQIKEGREGPLSGDWRMAATGDLSNLLGDDVDQQQALLDNILLLSTSEAGGLSRVMGDGEAGWEILVEFAFGRRFGWSEGGGEGIPKHYPQNQVYAFSTPTPATLIAVIGPRKVRKGREELPPFPCGYV